MLKGLWWTQWLYLTSYSQVMRSNQNYQLLHSPNTKVARHCQDYGSNCDLLIPDAVSKVDQKC